MICWSFLQASVRDDGEFWDPGNRSVVQLQFYSLNFCSVVMVPTTAGWLSK